MTTMNEQALIELDLMVRKMIGAQVRVQTVDGNAMRGEVLGGERGLVWIRRAEAKKASDGWTWTPADHDKPSTFVNIAHIVAIGRY